MEDALPNIKPLKITAMGRPIRAEQWAIFQAVNIAKRHMPNEVFEKYSALADDIAEALQSAWDTSARFAPYPEIKE